MNNKPVFQKSEHIYQFKSKTRGVAVHFAESLVLNRYCKSYSIKEEKEHHLLNVESPLNYLEMSEFIVSGGYNPSIWHTMERVKEKEY